MNMIYNSHSYCVVEFEVDGDVLHAQGGFEIMDKAARREIFIAGIMADRFREAVAELTLTGEPSTEEIDDYLSSFDAMMQLPVSLH